MLRHLLNIFLSLLPPSRLFALRRRCLRLGGIDAHSGVCFCGRGWIYGRGDFSIGSDTWLSPGVIAHTHPQASIVIGRQCDIGHGVEFIPGSHLIGTRERRAGEGTALPIEIGDGCWIGARTVILGGVSIGAGSVVAAGSVVTRNVSANVLVAGVPARVKRELGE